jgi:hypothetical protein
LPFSLLNGSHALRGFLFFHTTTWGFTPAQRTVSKTALRAGFPRKIHRF